MSHIPSDQLLTALNWRYATKTFDPTKKISPEDWATLEKSLILTASSFGLQPWKFIVITDQAIKAQLVPVSWGQRQVSDASHVVVFAGKLEITDADVTAHIVATATAQGIPEAALDGFKKVVLGFIANPPFGLTIKDWINRQIYLALGNFLTSAALIGIDTCPMEGFDPAKYDEILGLTPLGLRSIVVAPAGYRASTDKYATAPKVRFPASEIVLHI